MYTFIAQLLVLVFYNCSSYHRPADDISNHNIIKPFHLAGYLAQYVV